MFIFTWRSSWKEKGIISSQNNLKVHKMTKNKKYIGYWPFILAKNTTGWILGFYIAGLANNKKLSACPACTSCIKVCRYYFFKFFFKDFCCVIYINIFCVLFTINITFYRCFILSVLHIPYDSFFLYWAWLSLSYFIFSVITKFEVHGGQIKKIFNGLCYLMH